MTLDDRILALLEGREVGEACPCVAYLVNSLRPSPRCSMCHGTGRIRTTPEGPVEEAAAKLCEEREALVNRQVELEEDRTIARTERDAALAQVERLRCDSEMADLLAGTETKLREALARAERAEACVVPLCDYVAMREERDRLAAVLAESEAQRVKLAHDWIAAEYREEALRVTLRAARSKAARAARREGR